MSDHASPRPQFGDPGLTKRELIAAMAMQGLLSSMNDQDMQLSITEMAIDEGDSSAGILAKLAIRAADALLEKLEINNETS